MAQPEREVLPATEGPQKVTELAWLKENITVFWFTAYGGYGDNGRGAVIIDTTREPLGEDTPFYYAPQANIEARQDEVSQLLVELIVTYQPDSQFVAVFIRPREAEFEFSIFQIKVCEELVEAVKAYPEPDNRLEPAASTQAEVSLEPPDLDTLIEWESEGGCEAACPHSCWVEADGTCPHGHPSWLLKLGMI